MAKLKIIPLGGLGEIGKNLTVYEYGQDMFVVDCGLGFPDEELYGVDVVIPDITYLKQNKDRIKGIVITHGHEDHIGAIPYVMRDLDVPIYATPLTAGIIELKLEEHDLLYNTQIFTKRAGDKFKLGCFEVEFIHVNHSIADSVALAIRTPIGVVIHTGDFKIDVTPIQGEMIDLARLGQLGKQGVLALLSDSTNVERPGHTESERKVADKFDELFKGCDKRIIVTTFASNVQRIQQIVNVAAKYKRRVAVTGRSMENMIKVAMELGYMDIPDGVLMDLTQIKGQPKSRTVIISTGSQGESMSALYRMAFSEHKQINVDAEDRIIISASAIPGNETTISRVIDELFHKGAEVIYDRHTDLHVSGHASQEEQKMMLALTKPHFFIPVHGEYRMLCKHAEIAHTMGIAPDHTVVAENGRVIELSRKTIKLTDTVPAGRVFVDGSGVGDVGSVVLRDRKHLAEDGMIVVTIVLSNEDHSLIGGPDVLTRGFIYEKENENLIDEVKRVVYESLASCRHQRITDDNAIKSKIRTNLTGYLYKTTKRSPMILPMITTI
ncbi:MAG TPA: ribonuclease J [Candidatus Scatomorpha merdigallinarum]|nr:ribonuclease J [Candidatus Scatomorpha merdigallinarum]